MSIIFRLRADNSGRGELDGQLHRLPMDEAPKRVEHRIGPGADRETYDLIDAETGDSTTDDEGHLELHFVAIHEMVSIIEESRAFAVPLVDETTRVDG